MSARGIRNNNPGNIKDFGIPWEGIMADSDRTPEQIPESTFVVFRGPWWGIRAMAIILRNYSRRHDLNTVAQIIKRWAPGSDSNPTNEYATFVASQLDVGKHQRIEVDDYNTMRTLVESIVRFENGNNPYAWQYEAGLILAGIEPPAEIA